MSMEVYGKFGLKRNGPINNARFFWVEQRKRQPDRVTPLSMDDYGNAYYVDIPLDRGIVRVMAPDDQYSDTWVEDNNYYEVWI